MVPRLYDEEVKTSSQPLGHTHTQFYSSVTHLFNYVAVATLKTRKNNKRGHVERGIVQKNDVLFMHVPIADKFHSLESNASAGKTLKISKLVRLRERTYVP